MFERTISVVDLKGNKRDVTMHFNLGKNELTEINEQFLDPESGEGLVETMQKAMDTKDSFTILKSLKKLMLMAYGKISPDGLGFLKFDPQTGHKYADDFVQSVAFDDYYYMLCKNADEASAFFNNLIPKEMLDDIKKAKALEEARKKAAEESNA